MTSFHDGTCLTVYSILSLWVSILKLYIPLCNLNLIGNRFPDLLKVKSAFEIDSALFMSEHFAVLDQSVNKTTENKNDQFIASICMQK